MYCRDLNKNPSNISHPANVWMHNFRRNKNYLFIPRMSQWNFIFSGYTQVLFYSRGGMNIFATNAWILVCNKLQIRSTINRDLLSLFVRILCMHGINVSFVGTHYAKRDLSRSRRIDPMIISYRFLFYEEQRVSAFDNLCVIWWSKRRRVFFNLNNFFSGKLY